MVKLRKGGLHGALIGLCYGILFGYLFVFTIFLVTIPPNFCTTFWEELFNLFLLAVYLGPFFGGPVGMLIGGVGGWLVMAAGAEKFAPHIGLITGIILCPLYVNILAPSTIIFIGGAIFFGGLAGWLTGRRFRVNRLLYY